MSAKTITAGDLRRFVEQFERLEAEKKDIADQIKEVKAEARGRCYDVRVYDPVLRPT